jgi:diguanylate cyclase
LGRLRLTTTFALVSLAAMVALGVALVLTSATLMQRQALGQARRTAEAYVRVGVEHFVDAQALETGTVHATVVSELNKLFSSQAGSSLVGVKLWTAQGILIYDSESPSTAPGTRASLQDSGIPDPNRFETAIRKVGATSAPAVINEIGSNGETVQRLDVYVPVFTGPVTAGPTGVAEVVLSYDETAQMISQGTRTILYVVLGGLALVWLLLFRTVHKASRRLRMQASDNARLALLDPLTGLPNRRLFNDRLERAAAVSSRSGGCLALLLLDIDRFKDVNDTLGHPRGDSLLVQVAERLRNTIRESDTVARLGGDEFAILLPIVDSVEAAATFAGRVKEAFVEPFDMGELVLHMDTSIGLAVLPDHADDITSLMARADIAMYSAKASGGGLATYAGADSGGADAASRLMLLGDLRRALDTDELFMAYQPKVDLRTGAVVGLEALLRWQHPVHGLIPPADFIPVAEQTGLMRQVTARVLGLVAAQLATWRTEGQELPVAVNLSARNLLEPDLDTAVSGVLAAHGLPASLLEFEITESAIIEDPVKATEMLRKLTDLGVSVAVDDFGIGNTSMSQLGTMPLRTIKIDRSFVTNLAHDAAGQVLVKAIVDLAHEFGLVAVAEGVEDVEVINKLKSMGCDVAQGYLWSRPVAADDIPKVLERLESDGARV